MPRPPGDRRDVACRAIGAVLRPPGDRRGAEPVPTRPVLAARAGTERGCGARRSGSVRSGQGWPRATAGEAATATHYDVLGVRPEASHDEVKRAFTAKALTFHPDRQADRSPASIERAAWRMQEINRAWAVLRNPASRAAYDDELRAATASTSAPGAAVHDGPVRSSGSAVRHGGGGSRSADATTDRRFVRPEPEVADVEPVTSSAPAPTTGWFWQFLPVLVILGLLAVVLVVTAYAASRPRDVNVQTKERFAPGTCVLVSLDEAGRQAVDEVDCIGRNSGRVVAKVDQPRPCPANSAYVAVPGEKVALCLQPSRT